MTSLSLRVILQIFTMDNHSIVNHAWVSYLIPACVGRVVCDRDWCPFIYIYFDHETLTTNSIEQPLEAIYIGIKYHSNHIVTSPN